MSRALIVRGGWDGHQPVETTNLFAHFLQENGFEVQIEESSKVYANASVMDDIDLIVQVNRTNSRAWFRRSRVVPGLRAGTEGLQIPIATALHTCT